VGHPRSSLTFTFRKGRRRDSRRSGKDIHPGRGARAEKHGVNVQKDAGSGLADGKHTGLIG